MAKFSGQCEIDRGSQGVERRKKDRADLVVRVDYQTVDELFSDFSRDVNEGGIFVETEKPPTAGTRVDLQFRLPGEDEPVRAHGVVVHVKEGSPSEPRGMGIEFEELTSESRRRIDMLVRKLRVSAPAWAAER